MSVNDILSRLEKVKKTGRDSWVAACPAHPDKHPSMTIKNLEDGTILIHDFAGCTIEQIIGAVGLEFDALFPPKSEHRVKPIRNPFNAHDVLAAIELEIDIVALCALDLAKNEPISKPNLDRLAVAQRRIHEARELIRGE